jgi:hypothetical protein
MFRADGNPDETAREVASAAVWLADVQAIAILDALRRDDWADARTRLLAAVPELIEGERLDAPEWRRALREELEVRLVPPADDEQDDLETREMPDYARFAQQRS